MYKLKPIIKKIIFIGYLFMYLYMPVLFGINTAYLLGFIGWFYILIFKRKLSINIIKIIIYIFCIGIYIITVGYLNNGIIGNASGGLLYLAFLSLPGAVVVADYIARLDDELYLMIEALAQVALLQSCISIVFFFFDSVRLPVLTAMGYDINSIEFRDIISGRLYGVASGLTYGMPAIQAIIGLVILIYSLRVYEKRKYIWFVPLIWFSGVINARISIVLIGVGVLFVLLLMMKSVGKRMVPYLFCGIIMLIVAIMLLTRVNPITAKWLRDGLMELVGFITGGKTGDYFLTLRSADFRAMPEGFSILWGTGGAGVSDVGYIRYLWMGGILGSIFVYCLFFNFSYAIRCFLIEYTTFSFGVMIEILIIVLVALLNIKGEPIGVGEIGNLIILLVVLYYSRYKKRSVNIG